jgi:hypothetical protein
VIKTCPKCKTEKPHSLFYRSKSAKDGCSSYCKVCQNLRSTSYARENKDKIPSTGYSLKRRYGITSQDYVELLNKQNNCCAICFTTACHTGRNFSVDHDHKTGKVRGLLCAHCNVGLGNFKDQTTLLQKAIEYLKENT